MFPRHVGATRGIVSGRRREESRPRQEMSQAASVIFELETVLAAGPNDRRTEILNRMTDLFLGGAETFNNEQVGLFDGVLAHLIRSEEHTSELQSRSDLVCRLLLEKKKK